jgi:hypothetical protein
MDDKKVPIVDDFTPPLIGVRLGLVTLGHSIECLQINDIDDTVEMCSAFAETFENEHDIKVYEEQVNKMFSTLHEYYEEHKTYVRDAEEELADNIVAELRRLSANK